MGKLALCPSEAGGSETKQIDSRRNEMVLWRWRPPYECAPCDRLEKNGDERKEAGMRCDRTGTDDRGTASPGHVVAILRFCATSDALRDWVWRGRFGVYAFTAPSHFIQKDSILTPPYAKIAPLHVLCMLWTALTSACNTPLITLSACTLLCVAKRLLAPGSVQYACMCECVNVFGVCLQFSFLLFRLRHCYR